MTLLSVTDAAGGYAGAEDILKGASLTVAASEIVTVIGPNGAGKSTFLKAIAGLVPLRGGVVRFGDADITGLDAPARARAGISFVPQERNVFAALSVAENLAVSAHLARAEERARAARLYERYPMLWEKRRALARTLSGGQRQLLAIASALMKAPRILLLDEPTAGLAPKAADDLFAMIGDLNAEGLPILMIEQHAIEALSLSTRGYLMVSGRVHAHGAGRDLLADPEIRRLFLGG